MVKKKFANVQPYLFKISSMPSSNDLRNTLNHLPHGQATQIAKAVGVSDRVLSCWKSGRLKPSYDKGVALYHVLRERGYME